MYYYFYIFGKKMKGYNNNPILYIALKVSYKKNVLEIFKISFIVLYNIFDNKEKKDTLRYNRILKMKYLIWKEIL